MKQNPLARRDFLGATALLAAGFAMPAKGNGASSFAKADPNVALMQIAAILDRQSSTDFLGDLRPQCECARCRAIRRRGVRCATCGFEGAPWVSPCDCRQQRANDIRSLEQMIRAAEAGAPMQTSAATLRDMHARHIASPDWDQCAAKPNGENIYCGHGTAYCRTCGNPDGGAWTTEPLASANELCDLIRDVRAVLRAQLSAGRA